MTVITRPFQCYMMYQALKRHFSSNYDYKKYNGKIKLSPERFDILNDRHFYEKLAKKPDLENFIIANMIVNDKLYVRDLVVSGGADETYKRWLKRQQSLSYMFTQELKLLNTNFNKNFLCSEHEQPELLRLYLTDEISIETLCILLELTGASRDWNKKLNYDPLWQSVNFKIEKYSPFITYDRDKMKKIILQTFNEDQT